MGQAGDVAAAALLLVPGEHLRLLAGRHAAAFEHGLDAAPERVERGRVEGGEIGAAVAGIVGAQQAGDGQAHVEEGVVDVEQHQQAAVCEALPAAFVVVEQYAGPVAHGHIQVG
jgi:hypothetical protein